MARHDLCLRVRAAEILPLLRLLDVQTHENGLEGLKRRLEGLLGSKPRPPSGLRQAGRKAKHRPVSGLGGGREKALSKSLRPTKAEKRGEIAAIRRDCLRRAAGLCECGCGCGLNKDEYEFGPNGEAELDHFFGRGKGRPPQSVETCWILRSDCHRDKTNNRPGAAVWLERFITHCSKYDYHDALRHAAKRRAFVEARSALPAAPRSSP